MAIGNEEISPLIPRNIRRINLNKVKASLRKGLAKSWRQVGPMVEALVDGLSLAALIITIMEGYLSSLVGTIRICLLLQVPIIGLISALLKIAKQNGVERFYLDAIQDFWSAFFHGGTSFTAFDLGFVFFLVTEITRLIQQNPNEEVYISNIAAWGIIGSCFALGYLEFLRLLDLKANPASQNQSGMRYVSINADENNRMSFQRILAVAKRVSYIIGASGLTFMGGASTYHSLLETVKKVFSLQLSRPMNAVFDWGGFTLTGIISAAMLAPRSNQNKWYAELWAGGLDGLKVLSMTTLFTFFLTRPNAREEVGNEVYWVQGGYWPALFTLVFMINFGIAYQYRDEIKQEILSWFDDEDDFGLSYEDYSSDELKEDDLLMINYENDDSLNSSFSEDEENLLDEEKEGDEVNNEIIISNANLNSSENIIEFKNAESTFLNEKPLPVDKLKHGERRGTFLAAQRNNLSEKSPSSNILIKPALNDSLNNNLIDNQVRNKRCKSY